MYKLVCNTALQSTVHQINDITSRIGVQTFSQTKPNTNEG